MSGVTPDDYFKPDKSAFQDNVPMMAGAQPFDPMPAGAVPVIRLQLCFDSVVAK
jgi:hypothetical protein